MARKFKNFEIAFKLYFLTLSTQTLRAFVRHEKMTLEGVIGVRFVFSDKRFIAHFFCKDAIIVVIAMLS